MQSTDAAHSSEFRIFETEEFKKALARLGLAPISAEEARHVCLSPVAARPVFRAEYPQVTGIYDRNLAISNRPLSRILLAG